MEKKSSLHGPKGCCAIIVSYEPEIKGLLILLDQLDKEVDFIVIDNGSTSITELSELVTQRQRCQQLIRQDRNVGLACALNLGIAWAENNNYEGVLLFDQDSRICENFVQKIIGAYQQASVLSPKPVALIGPRLVNPSTAKRTKFKVFDRIFSRSNRNFMGSPTLFHTDFLITSGSYILLSVLNEIGVMKESYFIDNIDLEWCFRAKSLGFELLGTDQAELFHAIGEESDNPLVKSGFLVQHKPGRSYYTSRNRLHLYRTAYAPVGWKVRDIVRFTIKTIWLMLFSSERRQYWQNIKAGIRDAKTLT